MKKYFFMFFLILVISIKPVYAQRGCCSHHGGVSGCSESGRQICNDGTLSPTCTCTPQVKTVYGCTDKDAKNYNSKANKDDGTCEYYVYGCTNIDSINYNADAEKDDGSCIKKVYGCMDEEAINYSESANVNDDSCEYKIEIDDTTVETLLITESENDTADTSEETDEDSEETGIMPTIITLGIGGAIVYFYKKKKIGK